MDAQTLIMGGFGLLILLVAWFPIFISHLPLTLPMLCVAIGFGGFSLLGENGLSPRDYPGTLSVLTELTIIVSLAGAGLSIDRPWAWRQWMNTWRLLGIAMPLTIAACAALAAIYLGLPWETAVLIGAVIAPTDPVLAADVRVGPPREEAEDEVRFSLTSEAGLNDGLGFPFTMLALGLAAHGTLGDWTWHWLAVDGLWRCVAGVAAGWLVGRLLGNMVFRLGAQTIARTGQGFASLGITFVAYSAAEYIHGYGFIAVFVAALMLRSRDDEYGYHLRLHGFIEQIEHLLMMMLLVLFGGSLAGPLLEELTWPMAIAAIVVLFVIRPLAGMISLLGSRLRSCERVIVSLFGIRGVGSFFYLAYATNIGDFAQIDAAWAFVGFIVLLSIFSYGMLSAPLMSWLDRRQAALAGAEQKPG
ncbi:cation:proton antiporter [Halomonas sp. HP20-15]|uniref:cation:proton antiporter n=1 Tax=Halomonas sp. HP20-15 TaxID=3085901 RepID=UPI002981DD0C|nr:cation:proton antiporter [Halomonas sp. HP20-15]MDW5376166.1 cation:proton antiporter [Halomonas sp. HP20-15]